MTLLTRARDGEVPVILMGGLARGYYKSCTASVGGMDRNLPCYWHIHFHI